MYKYLLFNKPYEVLCQFSPSGNKRTLAEFKFPADCYPIGRLDEDSEGLLLLSNDKKIVKELLEPSNAHPRTYYVQVEGIPTTEALQKLSNGLQLKEFLTKPCEVIVMPDFVPPFPRNPPIRVRKNIPDTWLSMTLTEGKNRQVRRMTATIGHPTLRLIRAKIGNLTLHDLPVGTWREISRDQVFK